MPSPMTPAPMMTTRGRLPIGDMDRFGPVNAAPFAGMTKTVLHPLSSYKGLDCQSALGAYIDAQRLFAATVKPVGTDTEFHSYAVRETLPGSRRDNGARLPRICR